MDTQPQRFLLKHILRKVFVEDWVMKVVALAITMALWFGVTGLSRPTAQRLGPIPLTIRFPNNIEVTYSQTDEINLVVSGDSRRLAQIIENDLVASIDITDVPPGERQIPLTSETVGVALPTGVRIEEILPRSIGVRIEAVEEKEVPVEPLITGELPPGYELYGEVAYPPRVRVRGPSGFIRPLESVTTEPIEVTNRVTDFTARQVPITISNPKATVVTESLIDVTIRVGEKRIERVFMVPLSDGSGSRARVVLYAGGSVMEDMEPSDIRIEVSKNDAGREVGRAVLPQGSEGKIEIRSVDLRR